MDPDRILRAALHYAALGWSVLPPHGIADGACTCGRPDCPSPGKHPRTLHGLKEASRDPETIRRWYEKWPNANVGIVTGAESGLVVLDVDLPHGETSLDALITELRPLPDTREQITGGGGRHILFKHAGERVQNRQDGSLGPGLDVRGDDGYIVAAPSLHISGKRYRWDGLEDSGLAELPPRLLERLRAGRVRDRSAGVSSAGSSDKIQQGDRHHQLVSLGGKLRHIGADQGEIEAVLLTFNKTRCSPPKPDADVRKIARDIAQRYKPSDSKAHTITDLSQLPSVWTLETSLEWAVEGLFPRGSVILISAESGAGKTWLAQSVAAAVARGQSFLGRKTVRMRVLYLDRENPPYVVKARFHELGIPETPELQIWGGWVAQSPPGPGEFIIQEFAKNHKGLLIFDSLIDFHEGSEQSATETRAFMNKIRSLANLGATVVLLHHTGKAPTSQEYRGSSDIKASVDAAYKLTATPVDGKLDRLTLKCFKGRVAPGQNVAMQFRSGEGFVACDLPARTATTPEAIETFLKDNHRANQKEIVEVLKARGFGRRQVTEALKAGVATGRWVAEKGNRNELIYALDESFEEIEF